MKLPLDLTVAVALFSLFVWPIADAEVADYATVPKGSNPTLYNSSVDLIIQLDESTFNDTIFCSARGSNCSSFIVEFYYDWCGHCRGFAPLYKALARDIYNWSPVIKVAAINCADSFNDLLCRSHNLIKLPAIKYFPRNSKDLNDGVKLAINTTQTGIRNQLTQIIVQENQKFHFPDWPVFDYISNVSSYGKLWNGISSSVNALAIIFEDKNASLSGYQLLLDLFKYKNQLAVRRSLNDILLIKRLGIIDFPTMVIFRRGETFPFLTYQFRGLLLNKLDDILSNEQSRKRVKFGSRQNHLSALLNGKGKNKVDVKGNGSDCENDPQKCVSKYFVSESDMLKAIHYALVNEVGQSKDGIFGENLTALHNFLDTLVLYFPNTTIAVGNTNQTGDNDKTFLKASSRARVVFTRMRDFISNWNQTQLLPVSEWKAEFERAEADQKNPFPIDADWEHCKGSTPQFRGYTCGLWTIFHVLTVQAYKNSDESFKPILLLQSIRDWVKYFFGCDQCRLHFLNVTNIQNKIETEVKDKEDVFLYLWNLHNTVNARLKGDETEDPKYPKYTFPPSFLCPNCCSARNPSTECLKYNNQIVSKFIVNYYSNIKPVHS